MENIDALGRKEMKANYLVTNCLVANYLAAKGFLATCSVAGSVVANNICWRTVRLTCWYRLINQRQITRFASGDKKRMKSLYSHSSSQFSRIHVESCLLSSLLMIINNGKSLLR